MANDGPPDEAAVLASVGPRLRALRQQRGKRLAADGRQHADRGAAAADA
jgi:hypothetical protein